MHKFYLNHVVCIVVLTAAHTSYCPPKKGSKQAVVAAAAAASSEAIVAAGTPLSPRSPQRLSDCPTAHAAVAAAALLLEPRAAATDGSAATTAAAAQPTDLITLKDGSTVTRVALLAESLENGWDDCSEQIGALIRDGQTTFKQTWTTAIMTFPAEWLSRYVHDEYRIERARRMLGTSPAVILSEKIEQGKLGAFLSYLNSKDPLDGYHWLEAGLVCAMNDKHTAQLQQLARSSIAYRGNISVQTIFDVREYLKTKATANLTDLEEAIADHCAAQQELQRIANELNGDVPLLYTPEAIAAYAKTQAAAITKHGSNNYYPRDRSPSPNSRSAGAARAAK